MAKETRQERNARLRENRAALIKAGFSKELADRYKGASRENVRLAIERGRIPEPKEPQRIAGLASGKVRKEKASQQPKKRAKPRRESWRTQAPPNTWGSQKGRITYDEAGKEGNFLYLNKYTYIVTFVTKITEDGQTRYERKIVSIVSDEKLSKKDVFDKVIDVIISDPANESHYYPAQIIIGSLELVKAVYNPGGGR
jgi:hypothetical protein